MKRIIIILLFFCLIIPVSIQAREGITNPQISSDSSFSKITNNFSAGQKIYVMARVLGDGSKQKILRLLDSEKKELGKYIFNQSGDLFSVDLKAPGKEGTYYLDIKIEGDGSSFSYQGNINVTDVTGGEKTEVLEKFITPTPKLSKERTIVQNYDENIKQLIQRFLTFLTGFLK